MVLHNSIFTLATGLTLAASCVVAAPPAPPCPPLPPTAVPQGKIEGFRDAHCNAVYLGVPFAASTGGQNRWKAPQDLPKSDRPIKAKAYGPTCPQAISNDAFTRQDEDCLNLNIWAPKDGKNLPASPTLTTY
ncbi:hypothetical protein FSPOR_11720 [Fusarium sporotrichioides]|uniref:Carboxylesterase type B domain-containing protein n=1 Tax=Fusarium sporotrichioides TaxID=5514 RepID=A0A395RFJ7_FUSSP|nr:hypothetical protein FSPOR_11720 [Fusarium sporotrichioides]